MSAFPSRDPDLTAKSSCSKEASPASRPRPRSSSQLADRALWGRLSTDLQRRILQSRALSLPDLGKLAPLGTVFREVYHERCTHDIVWLTEVAHSVFGKHLLDTLLWAFRTELPPVRPFPLPAPQSFDLTAGDALPDKPTLEGLHSITVDALAYGLLAPGDCSSVTWRVLRVTSHQELQL
eukprot:jgi/Botrbrau1/3471/Bobra.341_2s0003.1